MTNETIHLNHLGFLCDAEKIAVVGNPVCGEFMVEDLARGAPVNSDGRDACVEVFTGPVHRRTFDAGEYGICDFSGLTEPGVYRLGLRGNPDALSFQFVIADGVFHRLPPAFLGFLHELRSGPHRSYLRQATHLDDAVRSDNGKWMDAVGGWYDAGDTRKWMAHSTLPAWGLQLMAERLSAIPEGKRDAAAMREEIPRGLDILLKMQDPESGMIYEDVGGGGSGIMTEGMEWWYENHAGCCADNSENRFTDNRPGSGDDRRARIQYNPIVQYTSISTLSRGMLARRDSAEGMEKWRDAAARIWRFQAGRVEDSFHGWTSVRAWRALAAVHAAEASIPGAPAADTEVQTLLDTFDEELGFWTFGRDQPRPYRGILHSAQPVIALGEFLRVFPGHPLGDRIRQVLRTLRERYVEPMAGTNPYGFIPFGCYTAKERTPDEVYRKAPNGLYYRFCMPVHHPQKINHGLSGHWMTWAYALALAGAQTGEAAFTRLAWRQIYWLLGMNDRDVSFVSGFGYNNPMPHSRFLGTLPGGFMNGFRGTTDDIPYVDLKRECEWNSTEYWNVPLSYCLLALSLLFPDTIPDTHKLGVRQNQ